MHLLDSNLIIAYFRPKEDHHKTACLFINKLPSFAILDYVLLEVVTVLQQKEGKSVAQKALDFLQFTEGIVFVRLSQEELEMTVDLFYKQEQNVSFVDASLLILGKERSYTIATFDKGVSQCAQKHF